MTALGITLFRPHPAHAPRCGCSVGAAWSQLFLESKECTLELASISRLCHPTRAQTLTQATSYNGTTAAAAAAKQQQLRQQQLRQQQLRQQQLQQQQAAATSSSNSKQTESTTVDRSGPGAARGGSQRPGAADRGPRASRTIAVMKRLRLCAVRVSRFSRARAAAPDTMIVETSSAHASTGRLHLTRHSDTPRRLNHGHDTRANRTRHTTSSSTQPHANDA